MSLRKWQKGLVHWRFCRKYRLERADKWYEHSYEPLVESDKVKILWDMKIQCDHFIKARGLNMTVANKDQWKFFIIDIAVPVYCRLTHKEKEKLEKNRDLKREIQKIWTIRSVIVVSWIVGALNGITKKLDECLEQLDITLITALLKKTSLFGTARILRKIPKY